jgi:hypothetical protein
MDSCEEGLSQGAIESLLCDEGLSQGAIEDLFCDEGLSQGAIEDLFCNEGLSQGAIEDLFCEGLDVGDIDSPAPLSQSPFRWFADLLLCFWSVGDTSGEEEGKNIEVEN